MKSPVLLLSLLAGLQGAASAVTLMVGPSAETTLNEDLVGNNMGGHDAFHAGTTNGGTDRRGLIAFDVSAIPINAVVTSASLSLTVPDGNVATNSSFGLHLMLTAWNEGNKTGNGGASAGPGEATWNDSGIVAWATPGAAAGVDYLAASSASTPVSGYDNYTWTSAGMAGDVQDWVDGSASNNGWILISELEGVFGTARRFASKESTNTAPTLTVEYTSVPEPASAMIVGLAGIGCLMRRRR